MGSDKEPTAGGNSGAAITAAVTKGISSISSASRFSKRVLEGHGPLVNDIFPRLRD